MNYLYNTVKDNCSATKLQQTDIDRISKSFNLQDTTRDNICKVLEASFKKELNKCQNDTTILGDSFSNVHPLFFTSIIENDKVFCGDLRDFIKMDKNPYTGIPFSNELKLDFKNEFDKIKSIVKETSESIEDKVSESLSVLMADVFSHLPYPNSIDLFIDASKLYVIRFIVELQRYDIFSLTEHNSLINVKDIYNLKFAIMSLLKVKIENHIDPYSITYAYNSIFSTENDTYELEELQEDELQDEGEERLYQLIVNNDMNLFLELIYDINKVISLDVLLLAIKLNRIDMIDEIIERIELIDESDIEEIVKEILYSKHFFLLPYLVDIKSYIDLNNIHIYIDSEIYNSVPDHTKEFIDSAGGYLHLVDIDIDTDSETINTIDSYTTQETE